MNANSAVSNAKVSGKLKVQPCEACGSTYKVEAHHTDYSKPLDVRWLCRKHHLAEHKRLRSEDIDIPGDRGLVMVRMSRDLHKKLKRMAFEEETSINKLLIRLALERARKGVQ
jgi:hypothetical protein